MLNKISTRATYEDVMGFLNTFEDVDDMLLEFLNDTKPELKILSSNNNVSEDLNNILDILEF